MPSLQVSLCGIRMSEDAKRAVLKLYMTCACKDIADLLHAFQIGRLARIFHGPVDFQDLPGGIFRIWVGMSDGTLVVG